MNFVIRPDSSSVSDDLFMSIIISVLSRLHNNLHYVQASLKTSMEHQDQAIAVSLLWIMKMMRMHFLLTMIPNQETKPVSCTLENANSATVSIEDCPCNTYVVPNKHYLLIATYKML